MLTNGMQHMKQRFHYELQTTRAFLKCIEYLMKSRKFCAPLCSVAALHFITPITSRFVSALNGDD